MFTREAAVKSLIPLIAVLVFLAASRTAAAGQLFIGNDTASPVQVYTTGGSFVSDFGLPGATGSALDGAGFVYTVQPGFSDSVITKYNALQVPVLTIHFTGGIENGNGVPSWIEDMAYGGGHTLWLSGFNGYIYHIDETGAIIGTPFDTGNTFAGVATDGTYLYTTRGFSGPGIDKRLLNGTLDSTIPTANGSGGIGYDASDNTLWAGSADSFGTVYHYDLTGTLLGSFVTPTSSNFHDGLEVGEIGRESAVPEPTSLALLGLGGASLAGCVWRRRKSGK